MGEAGNVTLEAASYPRHRFPAEIISHAVWLYHLFSLSLRDVELAERGIVVTHESIRHWCLKLGAEFARRLRRRRPQPGDTWHLEEVFIRVAACCTICGARWISTGSCSTSWCSVGATAQPPSVSPIACCMD